MILQRSLEKANLELVGDALPKNDRKVKSFQRLIAAMRATEAEVETQMGSLRDEINRLLRENLELQESNHQKDLTIKKFQLQHAFTEMELSTADQTRLLEVTR